MPTFTAIALDSLIEPGAVKSMMAPVSNSPDPILLRRNSTPESRRQTDAPTSKPERGVSVPPNPGLERGVSLPPPPNVRTVGGVNIPSHRRNGTSITTTSTVEPKHHWTQISPALYATPESTPLPDSPSSFPPSPYIINHKRRGPRLMKSYSEDDVATCKQASDEVKVDGNGSAAEKEVLSVSSIPREVQDPTMVGNIRKSGPEDAKENNLNGFHSDENGSNDVGNGSAGKNGVMRSVEFSLQQDDEIDCFVDPHESMSIKSMCESECNGGAERSLNSTTPMAEFYDAWEELSSESGPQLPMPDIENELREIRLSLLMEIEKRRHAEETLNSMLNQWQRIREQLSLVGLTVPADPASLPEDDTAADIGQQVYLARFVSNSIGRGTAKAEVEMEMEAQIKVKNFEIARLLDRLRYYEAVNQEMSQRNQEVVEMARRLRQTRKRRQKWAWGSIATAVTLGSAVLAYSYFQSGKGSCSPSTSHASVVEHEPKQ